MDISAFIDKNEKPSDTDLEKALGSTYRLWQEIAGYANAKHEKATNEWNYMKGWNFRIKDKKRAILYLLPRNGFFKVAFVFGQKATDIVMSRSISEQIKAELSASKPYAEGRGLRIDIKDSSSIKDIKELIDIKLAN